MNKTFLKKGILLVPIAFFVFLFFFELNSKSEGKFNQKTDFIIELREDGFFPQKLIIKKGQRVKFVTTKAKSFWPASNLHPSHTIYPEFDSKEPVAQDQSWSFNFTKPGEWKYHNHLAPIYKGRITVVEEGEPEGLKSIRGKCEDLVQDQRVECFEKVIELTIEEEGIEAAFVVLNNLYMSDPRFSIGCHEYTHMIGEEAYWLFAAKKGMDLTTKTSYCGYGFYHGFMETLMHTTGDIREAHDFCVYVDQQLGKETSRAGNIACYHGIGHGAVDAGDPRAWGDAEAIIGPGLEMCEMIGETELKLHVCGNGVFNALSIMFINSEYNLSLNEDDPFWICKRQLKPNFTKSCYRELTMLVTYITKYNFLQSLTFVVKDVEDEYVPNTIASVAQRSSRFYADEKYFSSIIRDCHALQKSLHSSCIGGFAAGMVESGQPEKEYIGAINFCQMNILGEEEQNVCFKRLFNRILSYYSLEKYSQICAMVDKKYRTPC